MTLDNEDQRAFLLEVISKVSFPGAVLDFAYAVKKAVESAPLAPPEK